MTGWPRVSQLVESSVNSASGVSSAYVIGMTSACGMNDSPLTRCAFGHARTRHR